MKRPNEVTKFNIITMLKSEPDKVAQLTAPEIGKRITEQFKVIVTEHSIYRWAKLYDFKYKRRSKGKKPSAKITQSEAQCINQRIRVLGIVIRNLCRELDIKHPSMLDRLLDGIVKQYGDINNCDKEAERLEVKVYETI
ncbi:MAG: hypothetical protein GY845_03230 [Planctomycetes bacterium]|nr:hypothetical protein [Planctomycetota bacterium]